MARVGAIKRPSGMTKMATCISKWRAAAYLFVPGGGMWQVALCEGIKGS